MGLLSCLLLAGCATEAQTGAVIGAGGGAVVGGVIGKLAGSGETEWKERLPYSSRRATRGSTRVARRAGA